jgi:hypothetical protein
MSYLPENDTPTLYNNVLWVANDGSYGTGRVLVVDYQDWTDAQWDKFNELDDFGDPSIEQVLAIAEMSVSTSDSNITMLLRKNQIGDVLADFYQNGDVVMSKRLTDNEQENLDDFKEMNKHYRLTDILDARFKKIESGAWMNDDDGNETNLDYILNELIKLGSN